MPQEETILRDGRIVRSESPPNLEMPFSTVDTFLTPTKSFYVRTHFPIPAIDRNAWWLQVEGEVEKPFAINYEQLITLKSVTAPVTLECAGNNRDFLEPKVKVYNGTSVQSAPRSGLACLFRGCLIERCRNQTRVK